MLSLLRKLTPSFILKIYHWALASLGALLYNYPSHRLVVIGVTGTKGKSTVVNLIASILEQAGYSVGLISTINFKIGSKVWANQTKQTMPGRFKLQELLFEMVKAGCHYAVIETSSEGIAQYRHIGINYDVAVFTNLSPEHIESHGSYDKYRQAKSKIFRRLTFSQRKRIDGKTISKVIVVNLDDQEAEFFLGFPADEKWGYGLNIKNQKLKVKTKTVIGDNVLVKPDCIEFKTDGEHLNMKLLGQFNIYNALAAIAVSYSQGIKLPIIKQALEKITGMPGRLEEIKNSRGFRIFIDYAHEPASLEAVYKTVQSFEPNKIIAILGSQGGGRDKAKRPALGKLAGQYADYVIVTNEDPYDEDPQQIVDDVAAGALSVPDHPPVEKIINRKEAISRALGIAQADDIVIITGKGSETVMAVKDDKKVPWDDREVVRGLLNEL